MPHSLMQFFKYDHLPEHLQNVSRPFGQLAQILDTILPAGAEKTVAMRKLLEAKDAGVRSVVEEKENAENAGMVKI